MLNTQVLAPEPFIKLCQTLVQTPSVNGQNPEQQVAEHVLQFARAYGLSAQLIGATAERPNVLVRVGGPGSVGLLLIAHLDTVAPGRADDWSFPPFAAEIHDGRLYGRGAADTKGGLVAALAALVLLKQQGEEQLPAPILLACVPDEESGATGLLGVRYLHASGLLSGRGAIYVYPGMDTLVIGHRGVLRLRLCARGKAAHTGSTKWQRISPGGNAITALAEILLVLEQYDFGVNETGLFTPFRTVMTPTMIHGGTGSSMVPDTCEAYIDIRLVPSIPREIIKQTIQKIVDDVVCKRAPLQIDVREEIFIPPTQIAMDEPIINACLFATQRVLQSQPTLTISGPANESYILNEIGIPTCILGPDGGNVHGSDEYVTIDSIFRAAAIYAEVALHLTH